MDTLTHTRSHLSWSLLAHNEINKLTYLGSHNVALTLSHDHWPINNCKPHMHRRMHHYKQIHKHYGATTSTNHVHKSPHTLIRSHVNLFVGITKSERNSETWQQLVVRFWTFHLLLLTTVPVFRSKESIDGASTSGREFKSTTSSPNYLEGL